MCEGLPNGSLLFFFFCFVFSNCAGWLAVPVADGAVQWGWVGEEGEEKQECVLT